MNKEQIIKQIEFIVNYEYDFYDTKEEIINDLEKILKGVLVFDELKDELNERL